jgi:hypothetical protein
MSLDYCQNRRYEIEEAKKTKDVSPGDVKDWILNRTLSFSQVQTLYSTARVPMFLDDVPVWVFACRRGCPEFFLGELDRIEAMLGMATSTEDYTDNDFPYVSSICGFSPVTDNKKPIDSIAMEGGQNAIKTVADILRKKQRAVCVTTAVKQLKAVTLEHANFSQFQEYLGSVNFPTLIHDKPVWLVACYMGWTGAYATTMYHFTCTYMKNAIKTPVNLADVRPIGLIDYLHGGLAEMRFNTRGLRKKRALAKIQDEYMVAYRSDEIKKEIRDTYVGNQPSKRTRYQALGKEDPYVAYIVDMVLKGREELTTI